MDGGEKNKTNQKLAVNKGLTIRKEKQFRQIQSHLLGVTVGLNEAAHRVDIVDAAPQLPLLADVIDADQQRPLLPVARVEIHHVACDTSGNPRPDTKMPCPKSTGFGSDGSPFRGYKKTSKPLRSTGNLYLSIQETGITSV